MGVASNPRAGPADSEDRLRDERYRALEHELQQAQQFAAIGQLAAGVAHEINTPMQYIGDNTSFLQVTVKRLLDLASSFERLVQTCRTGPPSPSDLDRCEQELKKSRLSFLREQAPLAIEQSTSGIDQVRSIVQALKEFSHPGSDQAEAMDVNHLVRTATTVTRNSWRYHAELVLELCENLPEVKGHPQAFGQVLINLIVNAADAIASRAAEVSGAHVGRLVIRSRALGDFVELEVEDNGCGIPEAIRQRVMEPFFTTKGIGKGTGQGLALAHSTIVEQHSGKFSFSSEVGRGTTFCIQLPSAEGTG
ncbi:MAG: ATP-binding protein [Deltaproteobacteria bacterium]